MVNGRVWIRPGNTADVLVPARLIDSPTGQRFAYGGMVFQWPMRGLTPNMVKHIQDTYFNFSGSPTNFFHKHWSNKLTVQTFNRATGDWEAYNVWARFTNFAGEATPALGGYDEMLISFTAFAVAPEGPDVEASSSYSAAEYFVGVEFDFSMIATNIGDNDTIGNTTYNYSFPTELDMIAIDIGGATVTVEYSTNNGSSYSPTPPGDLTTVTDLRLTYQDTIAESAAATHQIVTIKPNATNTVANAFTVTTVGDTDNSNDTDSTNLTLQAFAPNAINNLALWLDAQSDVYNDGGSSVLASNGETVDEWRDQTSNNYDATQGTTTNKPIFRTGQANGMSAVDFDGNDNFMTIGSISLSAGPHSLFVVIDADNSSGSPGQEFLIDAQTGPLTWAHKADTGAFTDVGIKTDSTWHTYSNAASGLQLYEFLVEAGSASLYINGTLDSEDTTGVTEEAIGGTVNLASDFNGTAQFFSGLIYEVALYSAKVSDGDRQLLENYFINKYAIP